MQVKKFKTTVFLILLFGIFCYFLYTNWHALMLQISTSQKYYNHLFIEFLVKTKRSPFTSGLWLIVFGFIYGVIHSAGPGHGKIIMSTYLATHTANLKKCVLLSCLSALLQGIVAIFVSSILLLSIKTSTKMFDLSIFWLELASFVVVILTGFYLVIIAIKKVIKNTHHKNCSCCNHKKIVLNLKTNTKTDAGVIFSIGLRPCSGALLILIFSANIGGFVFGILGALAISLGTMLTTSIFALIVYYARKSAIKYMNKSLNKPNQLANILSAISLIGGVLIIMMGVILCLNLLSEPEMITNPLLRK